jgi:hypothetical protein
LLEFSPVTVPANPEALATAVKSKNISLSDDLKAELHIEVEKAVEVEEIEETVYIPVSEIVPATKKIEVEPFLEVDKIS